MHLAIAKNKLTLDIEKDGYCYNQPPLTCWVSGYFRHKSQKILFNNEAAEYAVKLYSDNQLINEACHLNGSFTLIICDEINKIIFTITDRLGSIPIYFVQKNGQLFISDTYWRLIEDIGAYKLNRIAVSQLIQFGYVLGTQTIIDGVSEFPPHAITKINYTQRPYLSKQDYWSFSLTEQISSKEPELLDRCTYLFKNIFNIYCRVIKQNEWSGAIPLSGGMDSRLITWWLKKNNVPAVTYSYGTPESLDLAIACQVAEALDVPIKRIIWTNQEPFVDPHDILVEAIGFTTRYSLGIGAYAIGKECNLKSGVILPGHGGDFFAGSHIKYFYLYLLNWKIACAVISQAHKEMSDQDLKRLFPWASQNWIDVMDSFYETMKRHNDPTLLSLTQRWDIEQRQRRLILRECEIFKLFGFRVLMPFCDYEIMDFFTRLPRRYLYNQYLYRKMMHNYFYTGEYLSLAKINTLKGPILASGTIANIPSIFTLIAKMAVAGVNKIAKKANKTSVTPPVIFWDLWYHSPALRQYFQELLQDSMQCQNQFDMKILNQFLRQSTPRFTSGPLYHLGTIAHNKFRNYKSLHGNE